MGLVENMKDLANLIKKAGDADLYRKIVASEGEVIELTRENRRLEDRVRDLEAMLHLQKKMKFEAPFYRQEGDDTPFCPVCWEDRDKKMAIHLVLGDHSGATRWDCPCCRWTHVIVKDRSQGSPGGDYIRGDPQGWMR